MHIKLWAILFYLQKPFIPRSLQIYLRRYIVRYQRKKYNDIWPIDKKAGSTPPEFKGWPENKKFALILTHDVESKIGHDRCQQLVELEKRRGFRSSFNFVAEEYRVLPDLRNYLVANGFEVGVHGLKHNGLLYLTKRIFDKKAQKIVDKTIQDALFFQPYESKRLVSPEFRGKRSLRKGDYRIIFAVCEECRKLGDVRINRCENCDEHALNDIILFVCGHRKHIYDA